MIFFLLMPACSDAVEDSSLMFEFPTETVNCSHPDSQFEAMVQVKIEDEVFWENVHFKISQEDLSWNTNLQTNDQYTWWTNMQLYELNCNDLFQTEFLYENR